jgi:hypothetical protein
MLTLSLAKHLGYFVLAWMPTEGKLLAHPQGGATYYATKIRRFFA